VLQTTHTFERGGLYSKEKKFVEKTRIKMKNTASKGKQENEGKVKSKTRNRKHLTKRG